MIYPRLVNDFSYSSVFGLLFCSQTYSKASRNASDWRFGTATGVIGIFQVSWSDTTIVPWAKWLQEHHKMLLGLYVLNV